MGALVALIAKGDPAHGHRDPGADVVAEGHGAKKARAVDAEFLAAGEGRGHYGASRMRRRWRMGVVRLVGMSEHAVRERGIDGPRSKARPRHPGRALSAVRLHIAE